MDEAKLDELREELAALEAEEALVSAQRRHLHQKIDFGYATDEARAREREISERRQELHRRIDELRELLGLSAGPPTGSVDGRVAEPPSLTMRFEPNFANDGGEDLESPYLD